MQVSKAKEAKPERRVAEMFTGEVHGQETRGETLRLGLVKFSPGGRTKWHRHSYEQGLVITEGKGIVATEETEHVVEPGDVVIIPVNEKHWHGATETTAMAHISINLPGEATVLEPVEKISSEVQSGVIQICIGCGEESYIHRNGLPPSDWRHLSFLKDS